MGSVDSRWPSLFSIRDLVLVGDRRALLLVLTLSSGPTLGELKLPSVAISGSLSSGYRLDLPDDGLETLQMTNTAELFASSYIWQPWLATWNARLGLSYVTTDNDEARSSSSLVSGSAKVDLFPRSHFPLQTFLDVQDSRVDGGRESGGSDFRNIRFGILQRYHPRKSRSKYIARVERNIQEQLDDGSSVVNDFMHLQASHRRERHDLSGSLLVRSQSADLLDSEQSQFVLSGSHQYRSGGALSVSSNASLSSLDLRQIGGGSRDSELRVSSALTWRDSVRPLTVRANAEYSGRSVEQRQDGTRNDTQRLRVATGISYDISPALRFRSDLSANYDFENSNSLSSTQSASLTYNPEPMDLRGFRYNWSLGGGVRNESGGEDESSSLSLSGGHSLNRIVTLNKSPALSLAFNAGQNLSSAHRFDDGTETIFSNSASATLNYQRESMVASTRVSATDTMIMGETDSHLQVLSVGATLSGTINRFSNWSGTFNFGVTNSEVDGERSDFVFSSATARYRHQRLFGYKRLRFQSELRLEAEDDLPLPFIADALDVDWKNRIDYSLGRLDVLFTTKFSQDTEGGLDSAFFLGIRRNF